MRIGAWKAVAGDGTAVAAVLDDEIMSSGMGARVFLKIMYDMSVNVNINACGELTHAPRSSGYHHLRHHHRHPNHLGLIV
jgi:hypothetical protein